MYYIVNQNSHIIAAGKELLAKLSMSDIHELQKEIILEKIIFSKHNDSEIKIENSFETFEYTSEHSVLDSFIGELTLISLKKIHLKEDSTSASDELFSDDSELSIISEITDESSELEDLIIEDEEKKSQEDIDFFDDDFLLKELNDEPQLEVEKKENAAEEEDLEPHFNLIEDHDEDENQDDDNSLIYIDIHKASELIGISVEDYNLFINEYIDTALSLKDDLSGYDESKRDHAINTLSHLSSVLHLPQIEEIMKNLEQSKGEELTKHIDTLYSTFARLTTHKNSEEVEEENVETVTIENPEKDEQKEIETDDALIDLELDLLPTEEEEKITTPSIDLSNVEPIHFDFQLEEAANELSLPVELIEEFVIDFLAQAHEETDLMLKAYEKGDLSAIQKIGHLLKGTSSNLRIKPLADTLYKIQFCEDLEQLEPLIKDYWAHFLSFENKIKLRSN